MLTQCLSKGINVPGSNERDQMRFQGAQEVNGIIQYNGIYLNSDQHKCEALGRDVKLSPQCFIALHLLLNNPGIVFTSEQIMDRTHDSRSRISPDNRQVDSLMRHLRKRMFPQNQALAKEFIKIVYGRGYKVANLRTQI
jgi:DNA-binding response OmpR family regulator